MSCDQEETGEAKLHLPTMTPVVVLLYHQTPVVLLLYHQTPVVLLLYHQIPVVLPLYHISVHDALVPVLPKIHVIYVYICVHIYSSSNP